MKLNVIYISILLFSSMLFSNEIKVSTLKKTTYNLNEQIKIFNDSSKIKSINEIEKIFLVENSANYTKNNEIYINRSKKIWLNFSLYNNTNKEFDAILVIGRMTLANMEIYSISNITGKRKQVSGPDFSTQNMFYNHNYYNVSLRANEKINYFISVKIDSKLDGYPDIILKNTDSFIEFQHYSFLKFGILFGILFFIFLYNVIIYTFTKYKFYLYYLFYLFSSILFLITYFNIGTTHIWGDIKYLNHYDTFYSGILWIMGILIFSKEFLNTKVNFPKADKFLVFLIFIGVMVFIFLPFLPLYDLIVSILSLFIIVFFTILGILSCYKHIEFARYYLFSWGILLIGTYFGLLDFFGIFSAQMSENIFVFSILLELTLFSIILGQILLSWKKQKESAEFKLNIERTKREEILKKEIEIKTKDLKESLEERSTLLKEIHHRVKNNMQIIISFIRLQEDEHQGSIVKILKPLEERIRSMVIVHEMFYQKDISDEISIYNYIDELLQEMQNSMDKKVVFKNKVEDISFSLDRMIPLALIVSESLTNSIKHADYKENLEVTILSYKEDNKYTLCIKDNGLEKPKSYKSEKSIGIKLIEMMVRGKLKGKVDIAYKEGTIVKVEFNV